MPRHWRCIVVALLCGLPTVAVSVSGECKCVLLSRSSQHSCY